MSYFSKRLNRELFLLACEFRGHPLIQKALSDFAGLIFE